MTRYASMDSAGKMDFIRKSLKKRHAAERRLKFAGIGAICFALGFLAILFTTVIGNGYTAIKQTEIAVELDIPVAELVGPDGAIDARKSADFNWGGLVKRAFRGQFPDVGSISDQRLIGDLVSANAGFELREAFERAGRIDEPKGRFWIKASDDVDMLMKGRMDRTIPENQRRLNDRQIAWVDQVDEAGNLRLLALPLAVMSAIYLEYFARPGKLTDFIEVNINNLAAVPSIVFGLLGLAVFLGFFGMPRSAPLVGGMVLALMTLPTIIIASRAAIRAVPPSIRDAALGVGASPMQAATDHVLPLAAPGILTGTIIGLAQALGETAPLIMIGMVAFIVDVPTSITSPATAMPVQIFIWSDSAERAFYERASLAIVCLLVFLIAMNLTAVLLRRKLEKRW